MSLRKPILLGEVASACTHRERPSGTFLPSAPGSHRINAAGRLHPKTSVTNERLCPESSPLNFKHSLPLNLPGPEKPLSFHISTICLEFDFRDSRFDCFFKTVYPHFCRERPFTGKLA
jgi:hypothetical protein